MHCKYSATPPRPVAVAVDIDPRLKLDRLASLAALLGLRLRWEAKRRRLILDARP